MVGAYRSLVKSSHWAGLLGTVVLLSAVFPGNAEAGPKGRRPCSAYPSNHFEVCYFSGTDPATGSYLGTESEPDLGSTPLDRAFGINRDWDTGVIFANRSADISAIWVGRINFSGGRYHFTVFSSDGVRVYIDGVKVLDKWSNQGFDNNVIASQLAAGAHNIQIEWLHRPDSPTNDRRAHLRFHWDKAPERYNSVVVSPIRLDVFIMKEMQTCIAGIPWVPGNGLEIEQLKLHNQDGINPTMWQTSGLEATPELMPSGLKCSDPRLAEPSVLTLQKQVSFGFSDAAIADLMNPETSTVYSFARSLEEWTFGAIQPTVQFHVIEPGEFTLSLAYYPEKAAGLHSSWGDLMSTASPFLTPESDFAIGLTSTHEVDPPEPNNVRYHDRGAGGLTIGIDLFLAETGTGYSWVPDLSLHNDGTLLHEWEHQFEPVIEFLMGGGQIFDSRDGETPYPACGTGGYNTLDWYPESHAFRSDPDSPWCGPEQAFDFGRGIFAHNLLHHFDPTLEHYGLRELTGNHCDNGIWDDKSPYHETGSDSGISCHPVPPVVTITSPTEGSTFPGGSLISFVGSATDQEDGNVTASLQWLSDLVGPIGSGGAFFRTLPLGAHLITATAVDQHGLFDDAQVRITVGPNQPVVTITSPLDGSRYGEGISISFVGSATDVEDGNVTVSLVWTSDIVGQIGTGGSFSTVLPVGQHLITATAFDSGGNAGSLSIHVDVFKPKPCRGPRC